MRIQPISEISTHQQQNPFVMQYTGYATTGKSASLISFQECLKSQVQATGGLAMTRKAEQQAVGSIWGYYLPQWMPNKPELRNRARALKSPSEE